jgi:hypothetical protein
MGIDARMFVRIQGKENWIKSENELKEAYLLASTIGHENFLITNDESYGRGHHALSIVSPIKDKDDAEYHGVEDVIGKVVFTQDGPPIVADTEEQFIEIHLRTRYYAENYARGDWLVIRAVAEYLEKRFPEGEVWYGGDSGGVEAIHFHAKKRDKLNNFFLNSGNRTYTRYAAGLGFSYNKGKLCICNRCKEGMIACGGGKEYDFWVCDGCGDKAVKFLSGGKVKLGKNREEFSDIANKEVA